MSMSLDLFLSVCAENPPDIRDWDQATRASAAALFYRMDGRPWCWFDDGVSELSDPDTRERVLKALEIHDERERCLTLGKILNDLLLDYPVDGCRGMQELRDENIQHFREQASWWERLDRDTKAWKEDRAEQLAELHYDNARGA